MIIFAAQPELLARPDDGAVPLGALAAVASIAALALLVVTALWRVKLKIASKTRASARCGSAWWPSGRCCCTCVQAAVHAAPALPHGRGAARALRHHDADGHDGFRFTPGQFGWLTLWQGPYRITGHPFSFSSSAEAPGGRVAMTIRKLGDFTAKVQTAQIGQRVWLDGPYGAFTLGQPADMHVLIAGGIGITPMMSMLRTLADSGDKRPVLLFYGSKDRESVSFREEPEAPRSRLDLKLVHVLAEAPAGWSGERGRIDAALLGPPSAAPLCRTRILHLRPEPDDGRDRGCARQAGRAVGEVPFRALQLRLRNPRCAACSPTAWPPPPGCSCC